MKKIVTIKITQKFMDTIVNDDKIDGYIYDCIYKVNDDNIYIYIYIYIYVTNILQIFYIYITKIL